MPSSSHTADAIRQLRDDVRGRVVAPGDAEYDAARAVYYSGIDRRPAAVVKVADAGDVARVVSHARDAELPLAVRSGGHNVAGHAVVDGGLVLDLSAMRALEIDAVERTAWAETGLTAGAYTAAVGEHGLATGFGDAPSVGIGGITLGGGVGFLHRRYGLTIDNLLAAEIVTADGALLRTDAETHPDLFWAIRGGGGNFGVATRFRYRLAELGDVAFGMLAFAATPDRVADFFTVAVEAPDELSGMINITPAPPMPMIPAEHHGRTILFALLVHSGRPDDAERVFTRLRTVGTPIVESVRRIPYPAVYEGGEGPRPARMAVRSAFLDQVDRSTAESVLDALQRSSASMRVAQLRILGGAVDRIPVEATAFAHRHRRIMAAVAAAYERPDDAAEHEAWADHLAAVLRQGEPGAYIGFLSADGEAHAREAYPGRTWERLTAIKARYDPTNLFRLNQNVPPAVAAHR